jgi:1,4-dihydroxy-2-naphthoate octaprenyltransferase
MKAWIKAFRLRTLPLALACISMGSILAFTDGKINWTVAILSLLTTLLLQILSNLANDYGDAKSGVDSEVRKGPTRSVQTGDF